VKTIKAILQNEDAPLPRIWVVAWTVSPLVALAGLVQYFVPFFRNLDFDGKFLWLWLPGFCVIFPLSLVLFFRELRRSGKAFLGQGRMQHLLFARFIVPPAALTLAWILARSPQRSLEGALLVLISIWVTAIEQIFPPAFRAVPFGFLTLGLFEYGFAVTGPEVTLANILLIAVAIASGGFLLRHQRTGGR
jgi:hypothetical protein